MKQENCVKQSCLGICFLCMLSVVILSSCSEDGPFIMSGELESKAYVDDGQWIESRQVANRILGDYLELQEDDRYVLNISREDAVSLGVADEFYELALSEVAETNRVVQEAKKKPNCDLVLFDPQIKIKESVTRANEGGTGSKTVLIANGQSRTYGKIETSGTVKEVEFYCLLYAAIASPMTCRVTFPNAQYTEKVAVGSSLWNTTVLVSAEASGPKIVLFPSFETSCAQGGIASCIAVK